MKLTWTCVGIFVAGTVVGIVGKGVYNKRKAKKISEKTIEPSSNASGHKCHGGYWSEDLQTCVMGNKPFAVLKDK